MANEPEGRAADQAPVPEDEQEGRWVFRSGQPSPGGGAGFNDDGVEALDYNNPHGLTIERVWFDGKIVFGVESGELEIDPAVNKVAQEYQVVYEVELDERGKLVREPDRVEGQFNIYDSIPGYGAVQPGVAVQLRSRATQLRTPDPALGGRLPEEWLPDPPEQRLRELTRALSRHRAWRGTPKRRGTWSSPRAYAHAVLPATLSVVRRGGRANVNQGDAATGEHPPEHLELDL